MFVRVKTTPNSPRKSVQIVESLRAHDKVTQKIVRYVGVAMNDDELVKLQALAEEIRARMEEERKSMPLFAPEIIGRREAAQDPEIKVDLKELREDQRVIEGIHECLGALYDELGFNSLFGSSASERTKAELLRNLVLARLADPASKMRTAALLEKDFAIRVPLDRIYRLMDVLSERLDRVQAIAGRSTLNLFDNKIDVMLFDVTTLHFETQSDSELRDFGFSKNGKFNEVQVVLALLTTSQGLPLGYELFPGNTAEGNTLITALEQFSTRFTVGKIIAVADRAMFSEKNLALIEQKGWEFIVATRLRSLTRADQKHILATAEQRQVAAPGDNFHFEMPLNSRRLIVSYDTERAGRDQSQRTRALARLSKKMTKKGSVDAARLITNTAAKKYLSSAKTTPLAVDQEKVRQDTLWDGLHGVITNSKMAPAEALNQYRQLWHIEAAFRLSKHDLRIRPIYHWTDRRIKAHIALSFIAFTVARQAEYRVSLQQQSMSFAEIRDALLSVQASILRHRTSKHLYRVPSKLSEPARAIYRTFAVKRSEVPSALR